jgi:hypothetical protein
MNSHQMRQILDQAFRERAPNAYQEMLRQDELATYLDNLTAGAMESISTAMNMVASQAATRQPPFNNEATIVQQAEMARKTAEEVALSQALEEMPLELIEDEDEPDEPMSLYELTGDYWRNKMY